MPSDRQALRQRLWRLFLEELDEHGGRLERGLDDLARSLPDVPDETVAELFRSAHSLKGAAQAVGADQVGSVCHQMEEVLGEIRDGVAAPTADLLDCLGAGVDLLGTATGRLRAGGELTEDEVRQVIERLAARRPAAVAVSRASSGPRRPVAAQVSADRGPARLPGPSDGAEILGPEGGQTGTVRVAADKLDALLTLAHELVAAAYRVDRLVTDIAELNESFAVRDQEWLQDSRVLEEQLGEAAQRTHVHDLLARQSSRGRDTVADLDRLAREGARSGRALRSLADSFAESAGRARTVPFTDATAGLARVVQGLCSTTGTQAELVVEDADAEVDRAVVATLNDALRHLVRNAVSHGLETPSARAAAGKPEVGRVVISAALRSDVVEVTVHDDGRGVDLAAVATATGRTSSAADVTETALLESLFLPGLSTTPEVGPVSGRGVGLDVVRTEVEALGGSVTLGSVRGEGTRVLLTLPLTLSTMRAVLVRVAGEVLALPTSAVRTLVQVQETALVRLEAGEAAVIDGVTMRLVSLAAALGWSTDRASARTGDSRPALVVPTSDGAALLAVDELLEEREVVVRAGSSRVAGVPGMLGTSLLEDGTIALVMSPTTCVRLALATPPAAERRQEPSVETRRILLAEDTLTTRELERSILEGAGYSVLVARDGAEAWQLLQDQTVDVVVSDVNMPRMDGVALCRAIRSAPRLAALPLVLVTSLADPADMRQGLEAGADAYITKSGFGRDELLQTLDRLL